MPTKINTPVGHHVEVRLIGDPDDVAVVLAAFSSALPTTAGGCSRSRKNPDQVVQYAVTTAEKRTEEDT